MKSRYLTSRIPDYYDLGRAKTRSDAAQLAADLLRMGFDVQQRGKAIRIESSRVREAASVLRDKGVELQWAAAPELQYRKVEWPLILGSVAFLVATLLGAYVLLDNYYLAFVLGLAVPSLALLVVANLRNPRS
jgi:hypothetical protein